MRATVLYAAADVRVQDVPDARLIQPTDAVVRITQLMPDILEGRIQPGRVFDRVTNLDGVPDGYRAMKTARRSKS
jgi:threonine dehydrogenase-like Zn-dependent dehydrogenase